MAAPDGVGQPGADWDEAQCTAALALLERLQTQIDDLRLAIPRVIEPFHQPPNPSMFKLYAQGVIGSQNGIKTLNEEWRSHETQNTLEHTRKSLASNSDLSASASIPSYGWTERDRKERESKQTSRSDTTDETNSALTVEDVSYMVVAFQKAYPNVKLETQQDNHIVTTLFVTPSAKLKFAVAIERDANGKHKLNAECLGATEPFRGITRSLASRPQANDLKYLLDMIAAYKTGKGRRCVKCKKILDASMLGPTARRSKQVAGANGSTETVWGAFHEGCQI